MMHGFFGSDWSFFITSLISLFVIIDPSGNIFPFLALEGGQPPRTARHVARRACLISFVILALFAAAGPYIIKFFGISLPAFQIAGGIILFRIAIDMLQGRGHFNRLDTASSLESSQYDDVALVPLAVPLLAGPGAITTILVLASRADTHTQYGSILLAAAIVLFITYFAFIFADRLLVLFKENRVRLLTRVMGLILAALAVEFVLQGLRAAFPVLHQ